MKIKLISTASSYYDQMINLRMEILLNPIGIPRSYIDPIKENKDILIAAFDKEQMIGCCILTSINSTVVQLRQMAVMQEIQRSGIGAAIIAFAEEQAKESGFTTLMMNARDTVIPFYEKQGYRIIGEGFTEVNIPHHKMQKEL